MVNYTPNLNLAKPTLSDVADIAVISNNFDILDSALAKMVTTDSPQTITGTKSFESSLYLGGNNYVKKSGSRGDAPSSNTQRWWMIQRGSVDNLDQASIGSVTGSNGKRWLFASVYDADGKYRDVSILRDTEIGAGSNGEHIVPLSYLNSESKATYLVHRAGVETISGAKKHTGTISRLVSILPNRDSYASSEVLVPLIAMTKDNTTYDAGQNYSVLEQRDTSSSRAIRMGVRPQNRGWNYISIIGDATGVYATCPTPNDNAPADAIVTKGYPKMVTTDTEQTITGKKTFTENNPKINMTGTAIGANMLHYGTRSTPSVAPTVIERHGLMVIQDNGSFRARLFIGINTNNEMELRFDGYVDVNGTPTYKSVILGTLKP